MAIGIIGGSGVYNMDGLENVEEHDVATPYGKPSDVLVSGILSGQKVYFIPRHGRGHRIMPSEINHRANIYAFKQLGVDCVISVSAVGSLREELRPRDMVLPDQYFDRTKQSGAHTFFGEGIVAHVSFADPGCPALRDLIAATAADVIANHPDKLDVRVEKGGTYVNMEGPAFSTKAESNVYRQLGFDVIGMTSLGEAKLCREAELCYQAMAMVTDYDCWHETEEAVTVDMVGAHLMANTSLAREVLAAVVPKIAEDRSCTCGEALKSALITPADKVPAETLERMKLLIGTYI